MINNLQNKNNNKYRRVAIHFKHDIGVNRQVKAAILIIMLVQSDIDRFNL